MAPARTDTLAPPTRASLLDTARPRLLLVAFCLLAWLPGFFTLPATDRDEARFAQATRQMLETGDFVDIRNGAEARNRKPIGIYWLQLAPVAAAHALGIATENPIWPYRIPSLAGGLLGALATYEIGRRLFGRREALLAGALLASALVLVVETHIAKTDAALLGATTLAMAVLARAYLDPRPLPRGQAALFWLAVGAGILIKGPLTPMVAGLTVLALVIADRRARWLAALRPGWGVPLMLAVVLPWFVAIGLATHGRFFADAVGGDLAGKLAGGDDAHGAPPGLHLLLLGATLFPGAALAFCALPPAWRARRVSAIRFLLAWAGPSWLVFEAVPTKLPHYILPLLPALCLLAASWALDAGRPALPRRRAWIPAGLFLAVLALIAAGAAALPFVVAPGFSWLDLLGVPALLVAGGLAWRVARLVRRDRQAAAVATALLGAPLIYWAVLEAELPNLAPLWTGPRVEAALAAHGATAFAAAGYAEPSLVFAIGTQTALLPDGTAAAAFLAAGSGRVVLVESRQSAAFASAAQALGFSAHAFAEIDGFNYSNGRRISLRLYDRP